MVLKRVAWFEERLSIPVALLGSHSRRCPKGRQGVQWEDDQSQREGCVLGAILQMDLAVRVGSKPAAQKICLKETGNGALLEKGSPAEIILVAGGLKLQ